MFLLVCIAERAGGGIDSPEIRDEKVDRTYLHGVTPYPDPDAAGVIHDRPMSCVYHP